MSLQLQRRLLYIPIIHIDTNLINARQKLTSVNQLELWNEAGVILINMSSTAYSEAQSGNDFQRTKKANQQIFTLTPTTPETDDLFHEVEKALFPKGAINENQLNDVRIVCEAIKYNAILVTGDGASQSQPGGILGGRAKLREKLKILSPDEAVNYVRIKIQERDELNERIAKEINCKLPHWTRLD